jgi:hypothetical protein
MLDATDRRECNEANQKRVFNQILTAFAACQVLELNKDREKCVVEQVSQLLSPLIMRWAAMSRSKAQAVFPDPTADLAIDLPVAPDRAFVL